MNKPFQIGDVVSLVSGGPAMTISYASVSETYSTVAAQWFDSDGHLQDHNFHPDMLLYACACSGCVGRSECVGDEEDDDEPSPPKERAS